MLDSHDKEEGLCHIRLALGAVLGGAGTNMMGNGRTASPPLAEGGEHTAGPEKWTFHRGPPGCPKGWTARHAMSRPQICVTRDIWYGRLPLHTSTLLSLDGFVDVALESWVFPRWWDLWFMLWLLALMASAMGCTRGRALPYVLLCDRVTYPPHPSHTTVVVPPSLLAMCRPISPESFRLVLCRRLTFAPGGD